MPHDLDDLIARARQHRMDSQERFQQRVSFVWGQMAARPNAPSKDWVWDRLSCRPHDPGWGLARAVPLRVEPSGSA